MDETINSDREFEEIMAVLLNAGLVTFEPDDEADDPEESLLGDKR
jgi:hypothetical protein